MLSFKRKQRCVSRLRPPAEAAVRESADAQVEAVAVINEQFESCAGAIAKDEERAGEGVLIEAGFAECDERVNALAEVDGIVSEQDLELGDELDHHRQERRKSEQSVVKVAASGESKDKVRREPSERSITKRHSVAIRGGGEGTGNWKNVRSFLAGLTGAAARADFGINEVWSVRGCRRQARQIVEAA